MSSLRINHQSRAVDASTTSGDTARSGHADDGASFAVALGAAGIVPKDAAALLGGKTGDGADGSPPSHKRTEERSKTGDPAATLAGQLLLAAPAASSAPGQSHQTADAVSTTAQSALAANVSGSGAAIPGGLSGAPSATTSAPIGGAAPATAALADARAAVFDKSADAAQNGDAAAIAVTAAAAPANSDAAADGATASTAVVSAGLGAGWNPAAGTAGATADAIGAPSAPGSASGVAPRPVVTQPAPSQLAGLAQSLPAFNAGQPGAGDTSGGAFGDASFGAAARDRFAPVGAVSDAGNAGAAVALGGSGDSAALAASPTLTPGSGPDATAAATISDQVAGQFVRLVSSGSSDMVMRLHPPELGDLTVRVAVNGRDVSAWFTSPQPQVQSAISAAMGQLQTDLGNAGYNLNGAWVGADASGARQQGSNSPATAPAGASSAVTSVGLPASAASRPAASGLNIYV